MNIHNNATRVARLGALALAGAIAGCGGGANSVTPLQSLDSLNAGLAQHRSVQPAQGGSCVGFSITNNFNGHAVPAFDYIWFVSRFNGVGQDDKFRMAQSHITLDEVSDHFDIHTTSARISLHSQAVNHFNFSGASEPHGTWWLMAQEGLSGHYALNAFAWQVPASGLAGHEVVTWSANFWSKTPGIHPNWTWSAAAYSQWPSGFPPDYNALDVKGTDANVPPWNNTDPAGTPINATQYLIPGGMGNGGTQYIGTGGASVGVTPCTNPGPGG